MNQPQPPFIPAEANIPFIHLARNFFTNFPVQWLVPPNTKVVFVADFFARELRGGAELTMEALLESSPVKVFRVNSCNLTRDLILQNKDVHWVLGNTSQVQANALGTLTNEGFTYSCLEFDYKFCRFRSETLHQAETKAPCDCPATIHGRNAFAVLSKAKNVFWMSQRQMETHLAKQSELNKQTNHVVLSSCFADDDLDYMLTLKQAIPEEARRPLTAMLGGGSWVKGIEQTEKFLQSKSMPFEKLPELPYREFLKKLAEYQSFAFLPAGPDTCPRVVIEAKLLGCKQLTSENVLHRDEAWFRGEPQEVDGYLRANKQQFWKTLLG